MKNLNPLYEYDISLSPQLVTGGTIGAASGFLLSNLINKYFVDKSLNDILEIKSILLKSDSMESFYNEISSIDIELATILKQYEAYPNWKQKLLEILDKKIKQKELLKIGVKTAGTIGGTAIGGLIGNHIYQQHYAPLPGVTEDELPFELPKEVKNRKPPILSYLNGEVPKADVPHENLTVKPQTVKPQPSITTPPPKVQKIQSAFDYNPSRQSALDYNPRKGSIFDPDELTRKTRGTFDLDKSDVKGVFDYFD